MLARFYTLQVVFFAGFLKHQPYENLKDIVKKSPTAAKPVQNHVTTKIRLVVHLERIRVIRVFEFW